MERQRLQKSMIREKKSMWKNSSITLEARIGRLTTERETSEYEK